MMESIMRLNESRGTARLDRRFRPTCAVHQQSAATVRDSADLSRPVRSLACANDLGRPRCAAWREVVIAPVGVKRSDGLCAAAILEMISVERPLA